MKILKYILAFLLIQIFLASTLISRGTNASPIQHSSIAKEVVSDGILSRGDFTQGMAQLSL